MSVLSDWLDINKMNPAFQVSELCRLFGLKLVSANGIISFTDGDGSPVANYVVGKAFNFNLEEIETRGVTFNEAKVVPIATVSVVDKVEKGGGTVEKVEDTAKEE